MPMRKLLVADDSLTIQKVIRLALSNSPGEGYEIQTVSDGNDAIQQISLFRPNLVLIDVSLPGKDAFQVKAAINEHSDLEEVRFVLMSSAFEKYDESQAESVGFHGKLTKPFDPAHLRSVLDQAIQQVITKRTEKTSFIDTKPLKEVSSIALDQITIQDPSKIMDIKPMIQSGIETEPALGQIPPPAPTELGSEWAVQSPAAVKPVAVPPPPKSAPEFSVMGSVAAPTNTNDGDIKELTESTIRMSGLDDYQWTPDEKKQGSESVAKVESKPAFTPAFSMEEIDESSEVKAPPPSGGIAFEIGERTLTDLRGQTPSLPPLGAQADFSGIQFRIDDPSIDPLASMPEFRPENAETVESPESSLRLEPPSLDGPELGMQSQYEPEPEGEEEASSSMTTFGSSASVPPSPRASAFSMDYSPQSHVAPAEVSARRQEQRPREGYDSEEISPLSDERLEMLIKKQLEVQFQSVVQRLLPEIAERVIREEISKLLRDGP